MAQGRSTKIISMINWIRTSRLLSKKSLFVLFGLLAIALHNFEHKVFISIQVLINCFSRNEIYYENVFLLLL